MKRRNFLKGVLGRIGALALAPIQKFSEKDIESEVGKKVYLDDGKGVNLRGEQVSSSRPFFETNEEFRKYYFSDSWDDVPFHVQKKVLK